MWTAVPAAGLWVAGELADSTTQHFLIGLPLALGAMILWGTALVWLNGLYLRVTGQAPPPGGEDEEEHRLSGPLEPLLVWSLYIAVVVLLIWFFAFAQNPPPDIQY